MQVVSLRKAWFEREGMHFPGKRAMSCSWMHNLQLTKKNIAINNNIIKMIMTSPAFLEGAVSVILSVQNPLNVLVGSKWSKHGTTLTPSSTLNAVYLFKSRE